MRFEEFTRKTYEAIPAIGKVAKGLGKIAGTSISAVGGKATPPDTTARTDGEPQSIAQSAVQKQAQKAQANLSKQLLKKGSKVPFPTQSGQAKEFEIDNVTGDEVTLVNPDARSKPEEPEKLIYKKKDVDTVIQTLGQQQ